LIRLPLGHDLSQQRSHEGAPREASLGPLEINPLALLVRDPDQGKFLGGHGANVSTSVAQALQKCYALRCWKGDFQPAHPLMDFSHRLIRGGSWYSNPRYCRSAHRDIHQPVNADFKVGFRVVCLPKSMFFRFGFPRMNNFQILIPLVRIPAGEFLMGSADSDCQAYADEKPQHLVKVPAFDMGRTPVTQAQWRVVAALPQVERSLNPDPSYFKGDDHPVEQVSWYDAMEFCARLSKATGRHFTLPSEAQWEYACRAGTKTTYNWGDTITPNDANFKGDSTTPVGRYPANAWGLHDKHGNVWEWCLDEWHDSYEGAPTDGSAWGDDNGLGKYLGAAPGTADPATAARPAERLPSRPTSKTALGSASRGGDRLGKLSRSEAAPPFPASADRPAGSASTRPGSMPSSGSASWGDDRLGKLSSLKADPGSANFATAARPAGAATPRPASITALGSASWGDRLLRGGSWILDPLYCRSAYRFGVHPATRLQGWGFRVCCLPQNRSIFTGISP